MTHGATATFSHRGRSVEQPQELAGGLLVYLDHRVVQGVLVLVQPAANVVVHGAGVVHQGEVGLRLALGLGLGFLEGTVLPHVLVVQLVLEGGVGGLGEHALLLQDGEEPHWLGGEWK